MTVPDAAVADVLPPSPPDGSDTSATDADTADTVKAMGDASVAPPPPCAKGLADCNGTCVNLETSFENCGSCGWACGDPYDEVYCQGGKCLCWCFSYDILDCDGSCDCSIDALTNPKHCGVCFNACASGETCQQGKCKAAP